MHRLMERRPPRYRRSTEWIPCTLPSPLRCRSQKRFDRSLVLVVSSSIPKIVGSSRGSSSGPKAGSPALSCTSLSRRRRFGVGRWWSISIVGMITREPPPTTSATSKSRARSRSCCACPPWCVRRPERQNELVEDESENSDPEHPEDYG